jgi:hypothetical protein
MVTRNNAGKLQSRSSRSSQENHRKKGIDQEVDKKADK